MQDHLGSTNFLLDEAGQVVSKRAEIPFGMTWKEENGEAFHYGYTGKEKDREINLTYFGARFYIQDIGRWLSPDPLFAESTQEAVKKGSLGELNLYSYVSNNPVMGVDSSGLDKVMLKENQINTLKEYGWGHNGSFVCSDLAQSAAKAAAKLVDKKAVLSDSSKAIGVFEKYTIKTIQKTYGKNSDFGTQKDIEVDKAAAKNALNYIKSSIDNKLPVVAGVNVSQDLDSKNWGEVIDHFVVISGYETNDKGEIITLYAIDNSTSDKSKMEITFKVDPNSGKIYKGTNEGATGNPGEYQLQAYQIDQVRQWSTVKPENSDGVGATTDKNK